MSSGKIYGSFNITLDINEIHITWYGNFLMS